MQYTIFFLRLLISEAVNVLPCLVCPFPLPNYVPDDILRCSKSIGPLVGKNTINYLDV
jgi:hypothetical protein